MADNCAITWATVPSTKMQTYKEAREEKEETPWREMACWTVGEAKDIWLEVVSNKLTQKNYRSAMNFLIAGKFIDSDMTLQEFYKVNFNNIMDGIGKLEGIKKCTKQARAACFISFTRFLSRRSCGIIPRVIPCKEGKDKTFTKVHAKVVTNAMTKKEWLLFLDKLKNINKRDCLIAKLILQGGKRINEVLSLRTDKINFEKCEITFKQSKIGEREDETVITYSQKIMEELKGYLNDRSGLVFITRNRKPIHPTQLNFTFALAGKSARIGFKVTPHVLRASCVTYLKNNGFSDSDIKKITGHASDEQVQAYDKTSRAQNPTKMVNLIE